MALLIVSSPFTPEAMLAFQGAPTASVAVAREGRSPNWPAPVLDALMWPSCDHVPPVCVST
ncbi:MAG: hypothetical protein R3F14_06385 [Polyangiaceae bacterium]